MDLSRRRSGRLARALRCAVTALLASVAAACSSPLAAPSRVTIRVTNTTCATGPCAPLRVLAFPSNQPRTPGGLWSIDLGLVDSPSACLSIAPSAEFRVTNVGNGETTTYRWSTADGVSLGALPPSAPVLQAAPSTPEFVPASASGWMIDLPGGQSPAPSVDCSA